MSLDLAKVASQVGGMVARLKAGSEERQKHLQCAFDVLCDKTIDIDSLKSKITSSRTTWLVAGLVNELSRRYQASPAPEEFSVIATDGSQIDVDRHRSTMCYLINIGEVILSYGAYPNASLDSYPSLYFGDEDLVITPDSVKSREQPIEGALLGIKRGVEECRRLANMAVELPLGSPVLALLDGSLILWGLEAYPDFVTKALLKKRFLGCLDDMRELNSRRQVAPASYISFSRSTDVVNALRVSLCPYDRPDCDHYCSADGERACDAVSGVRDRDLFSTLLEPGERSAIFITQSAIVEKHYGVHRVYFFYVRVGGEVARVEVPQWVALNHGLLELVHSLVLDQCWRGHGYPVALSEAHEKAVVTGADRERFWQFVETSLLAGCMSGLISAKNQNKRTRWV
jgi:hypothetical protein